MKALLNLLAGFGIVASATTTVIACGTKKDEDKNPSKPNEDISELIKELKTKASDIISSHINSKKDKLLGLVNDGVQYNFFNRENIEKYGKSTDISTYSTKEEMTEEIKENIAKDFSNILNTSDLEKQLNDISKTSDKYDVILWNGSVVDSIDFDKSSIDIKYTNKDWQQEQLTKANDDYFLSSTIIKINIAIQYKNEDGIKENFTTTTPLSFTYTNDKTIVEIIKNIQTNIKKDFLATDSKYSWLDYKNSALNISQNKTYEMFDLFNENKRMQALKKIYTSDEFKTDFSSFIKSKYLNNININLEYEDNKVNFKSNTVTKKIETTKHDYFLDKQNSEEYSAITKAVMEKIQQYGDQIAFKDYGTKQVNNAIYSLLNKNLKGMLSNYQTDFSKFLTANSYEGNYKKTNSFMHGNVLLEGLLMRINENYVLPINAFELSYSASIDNSESSDNNNDTMIKDTSLGNAIYFNVIKGLESFQNVFDTREPTILNNSGSKQFRTPFAFSGKVRDGQIEENIWDKLKNSDGSFVWNLNESLSLNYKNQINFRDKLLEEGYQSTFRLATTNFNSNNSINDIEKWYGIYSDLEVTDQGYKETRLFSGFTSRTTALAIKMNFIYIAFVCEQYKADSSLQSIFIERSKG
ncbi:hypothetical protein [Spiroplasma floricola]|uniref:Lipoprotein n=1 Tax=Spiroplasma floricola 23-6 TaxID=1336749 RepID=A0A2K8SE17_9MOLU|nr:hypothetical protein [Spiroplasma floricola]AUB31707.1 hypothetical protein SFLOR_v1c06570 [Spiroplasma floricola 23-6]